MFFCRVGVRRNFVSTTRIAFGSLVLAVIAVVAPVSADVIDKFDNVLGTPTGEFGWDDYNGASYVGPHTPDQFATGVGGGEFSVTAGGFFDAGNLYSLNSTPAYTLSLTGLDNSNSFTSLAVQVATTDNLTSNRFSIGGSGPDEFINLGQRHSLDFGGDAIPVNFYWAEWIGLSADTDYTLDISAGFVPHRVMTGTKVSYFNTSSAFNISAVPEPGSCLALGILGLCLLGRRRKS